jgi:hypothetical protein
MEPFPLQQIIDRYHHIYDDRRVTLKEVISTTYGVLLELIHWAASLDLSGPEKKGKVLAALETFIDEVITPLDLPFVPNVVIEGLVDRSIKSLLMNLADSGIDQLVASLRQVPSSLLD